MRSILLVERVPLFRAGLRIALERIGEFLILESTGGAEITALVSEHHPDVVILDASFAAPDALELTWSLRQQNPAMGIFILASSPDEEHLFQFVRRGASAYETRCISPETLVDRVRRVCDGEYVITSEVLQSSSPKAGQALHPHTRQEANTPGAGEQPATSTGLLSARELEILRYLAVGNSNKEIAKLLKISDQTVKNHITSILKKLSVNDRTAAVVHALRHHWISLDPSVGAVI